MKNDADGDDDRVVEEIYDALDSGDARAALARARTALHELGEDPVLHFLAGSALLDLDEPADAADDLQRAVALDPDDVDFRATLAYALYRACRFGDAADAAVKALEADSRHPDALHAAALIEERGGRFDEADRKFARASTLDPERFPPPVRISREEFEKEVVAAGEMLPPQFRLHLAAIAVSVEDLPSAEILTEESPPLDPELLGLFVGSALDEVSFQGPVAVHPPRILLFKRNLERQVGNEEELREEIARTLHHELAHYLGFEEEDMPGLDLD